MCVLQCVDALLSPLNLHPVEYKTVSDKFAAVGILQVNYLLDNITIKTPGIIYLINVLILLTGLPGLHE